MGTSSSDQRSNQLSRNESIKCILKGTIVALICTLALCILGGILQSFVELSSNFISNMIPIFGYISGGVGGIYAAWKCGRNGFRIGILTGLIYYLIIILISFLVVGGPIDFKLVITRGLITMLVAMIGGMFGVNLK